MNIIQKLRERMLGPPKTASYKTSAYNQFPDAAYTHIRDLPMFSWQTIREMLIDPTVRLGLAMRAAPLYQAEFSYKVPGPDGQAKWIPGVQADTPEVSAWILKQVQRIWRFDLHKILAAQTWGWSAGEVTWKVDENGIINVDRLLSRSSWDTLALKERSTGSVQGVRFIRLGNGSGIADLKFPAAFWMAYDPEGERPYGTSICKGSLSPWADKWLNGGALDVRRLFAHKDAYGGVDMSYPPGTTMNDSGEEVPNRDIARELAEQIKAGGVTTRPSEAEDGRELWTLTRATIPSNPTHIFEYPKDLDTEILRGLEIPDDVIKSEATGAWQGKQVPMLAFYTSADKWLAQVVQVISTQLLEPGILANWGRPIEFEATTKPLAEQAMDQINSAEEPGQGQAQPAPQQNAPPTNGESSRPFFGRQRFGLAGRGPAPGARLPMASDRPPTDEPTVGELLVGRGVIDAAGLVTAARKYLDNGKQSEG